MVRNGWDSIWSAMRIKWKNSHERVENHLGEKNSVKSPSHIYQ